MSNRVENYKIQGDRKSSLVHDSMRNIAQMIGNMKLQPGDRLPSEPELCSLLNVSRVVVREAIAGLNGVGLVESRHGIGTIVMEFTQPLIQSSPLFIEANLETLREVVQTRRIFEMEVAKIAAMNRSDEDLKLIERVHLIMGLQNKAIDDLATDDINFHMALVYCTKNKFLYRLLSGVGDILRPSRAESFKDPTAVERTLKEHGEIVFAIKNKNPEMAVAAMDRHLRIVEEKLK
ncbi:MAG: FadR/GntR family transcriptional regulator [Negativicutes bacterium]